MMPYRSMNLTGTQPLPVTIAVTTVADGKAKAERVAAKIEKPKATGLPTPAAMAAGTIIV